MIVLRRGGTSGLRGRRLHVLFGPSYRHMLSGFGRLALSTAVAVLPLPPFAQAADTARAGQPTPRRR
jgi:hypothetical protein